MKTTLTRLFTVMMLIMVSMGAKADVKVLFGEKGESTFKSDGGTIEVKQDVSKKDATKITVYLIVTPNKGYSMKEKDAIEAYATAPANINPTRAPQASDKLTLDCDNFKDEYSVRTYHVDIDPNLALWVKSADFQKKEDGSKGNRETGPVVISESTDNPDIYLIQSYSNEVFYMRNNDRNNAKNINTSNIVTTNSEFYFLDAGKSDDIQYYNIVHKGTNQYVYLDGTAVKYGDAPAAEATDAVKDKYCFKIVKNNSREAYNIIPKGGTQSLYKKDGNWYTTDISLGSINDDLSCWNFIAKKSYTKTSPPFDVSTLDGEKHYYKVQNNNNQNLYMAPGSSYVSTSASAADLNDMVWFFVKADINDPYLDYYYIIHPKDDKYLRHTGVKDANINAVELKDYKSSERDRFLYIIVPGTNADETHDATTSDPSTYCIAPKNVMTYRVENTISLSTFKENGSEAENNGQAIKSFKERNGNKGTHWNFIPTTYNIACDPPTITYDEATNKVTMSHSDGATIYYTTDGSDPTVPASGTTQVYSAGSTGFQVEEGVSAIKAVASKLSDGSDKSDLTVQYIFIEVASSSEITEMNGAYRLATNFTSSATIGTTDEPFKGVIDGKFNAFSLNHALIGVAEDATIKNVVISNASVSGSGNVGAIVNLAKGTTRIYNCGVQGGTVSGGTNVGGLVGLIQSGSKVRVVNCYNYANVSGSSNAAGIVGKNEGTVGQVRIALCMMYGSVSGATNISPVYTGNHISNAKNFTEYNFYLFSNERDENGNRIIKIPYTAYNDQLAIDKDDYLIRFPFYRHILNTHRELAAYFLFANNTTEGYVSDITKAQVNEIGHWAVKKGDDAHKYPIIERWEKNRKSTPTQTNNNLPNTNADYAGKLLTTMGKNGYLSVSIIIGGNSYSASLPITDMDTLRYDYTYGKVILPFANEYEINEDYSKICTGWKITSVTGGTAGSFANYNFADRNCTAKDIYNESTNPFIYAQGGYYVVPTGVTDITITANFAKAYYLSDATYEIGYNSSYAERTGIGGGVLAFHDQTVYNSLDAAVSNLETTTDYPHKQAIVLVGNYHYDLATETLNSYTGKGFTLMSIDADNNQEPDYGFYSIGPERPKMPAMRFDFLPIISLGMAAKVNGSNYYPGVPVWKSRGWYEQTETTVSIMNQFELDSGNFNIDETANDYKGKGQNPCIINGGYFVQMIRSNKTDCSKVSYFKIGGNAYIKEFYPGAHSNTTNITTTIVPVNVTGGQVEECFMTGYKSGGKAIGSDIRFWCSGGKIGKFLGAYMDKPLETSSSTNDNPGTVNMTALVDHALISRFFGGGTSKNATITGDIKVTINNSKVDYYCGGPEFGDMKGGKTVETTANNTKFGDYYGAGFGGTSITYSPKDGELSIGRSVEFSGYTYDSNRLSRSGSLGLATCYKFEFLMHSFNKQKVVARFITGYADFSLATTGNVTNNLTGCIVENDFYGAGCQGKVDGTVTSTLTNCTIKRSAFGGGYKATSNKVKVYPAAAPVPLSVYNGETGIFSEFATTDPETFTWEQGTGTYPTADDDNDKLKTSKNVTLTDLGNVTGAITLTIDGGYVGGTSEGQSSGGGNVYGGGNESKSLDNTTVNLKGTAHIYGDVFGGGNKAPVSGSATVNIEQ